MPQSEKQRRAAFAEVSRRRKGGKDGKGEGSRNFSSMETDDLAAYARSPLHKKKGKGKGRDRGKKKAGSRPGRPSAQDQADALAVMK